MMWWNEITLKHLKDGLKKMMVFRLKLLEKQFLHSFFFLISFDYFSLSSSFFFVFFCFSLFYCLSKNPMFL